MNLAQRLILGLYAVCITLIAATIIASLIGWQYPLTYMTQYLSSADNQLYVGIITGIFIIISIFFIYLSFRPGEPRHTVVRTGEAGEVSVSLDATENVLRRVALGVPGLRDAKAKVTNSNNGVAVALKLTVSSQASIPQISEDVENTVRSYIQGMIGVNVSRVKIFVESIADEHQRS